jgi:isopenicillin N synthase-like dioxygenase
MKTLSKGDTIPVVDINPLISSGTSVDKQKVVEQIYNAFTTWGFCQLIGHGVLRDSNDELFDKLFDTAEEFFAQPLPEKMELDVKTGGTAWRGYVPVGSEGTHGKVDRKEGIYFGPEHHEGHPNLGLPLYGKNQFPKNIPAMRESVLEYIARIEEVGKTVCDAMSSALGLEPRFIRDHFLQPEPVVFFRAWRYEPRQESDDDDVWGIGEHSGISPRYAPFLSKAYSCRRFWFIDVR